MEAWDCTRMTGLRCIRLKLRAHDLFPSMFLSKMSQLAIEEIHVDAEVVLLNEVKPSCAVVMHHLTLPAFPSLKSLHFRHYSGPSEEKHVYREAKRYLSVLEDRGVDVVYVGERPGLDQSQLLLKSVGYDILLLMCIAN